MLAEIIQTTVRRNIQILIIEIKTIITTRDNSSKRYRNNSYNNRSPKFSRPPNGIQKNIACRKYQNHKTTVPRVFQILIIEIKKE